MGAMAHVRRMKGLALAALAAMLSLGAAAAIGQSPEDLVRTTTDKLVGVLKKEQQVIDANPDRIYDIVDEYVLPNFDFRRMSQRVLGKFWNRASEEQQSRFVEEFKTLLVRTYATALREYSDQKIDFLPTRSREDGEVSVRMQVNQSGGPPVPIHYEMYKTDVGWKVYDVAIDGVSLVINYRSTFAAEIRDNGVDGLIDRLVKHNSKKR